MESKQRSANAERQARYRDRKRNQALSDGIQSVLPTVAIPQQVTNSVMSPIVALGDNVKQSVNQSFQGYQLTPRGYLLDDIVSLVQQGRYRYVVIDSISNLNLSNNDARQFVKWLSSRVDLLMYSLHATKDGDFQGSMSLLHDTTVQIEVESGVATVRKNRCGESGKVMNLFPQGSPQIIEMQKSTGFQRYA
jgi:hypothetical protein